MLSKQPVDRAVGPAVYEAGHWSWRRHEALLGEVRRDGRGRDAEAGQLSRPVFDGEPPRGSCSSVRSGAAPPGLPDHTLLGARSGVLAAAAAQLAEGGPHASLLTPLPGTEGAEAHARTTMLAAPPDVPRFAASGVLASPAGDLHGLSRRELQVLGLLVTGASNNQIAADLEITARTVAVHVDHVRAKLAAPFRPAAAARALRLGLFVPSSVLVGG
jgi:DNA-binding CsgD family transcriptional regulator